MSIATSIEKNCKQTALYWGTPVKDGYGSFSYADPVEIYCRWEDKIEVITDSDGKEYVSKSQVYVLQDVDEDGYLYLGDLDDLDSAAEESPETVTGAYRIQRFDKSPALTSGYIRKVYL